jgi:RNase adaptor protein for sRNA GlmZ degradation
MGDELVARVPQLIGMAVAGKVEGVLDRDAIDRGDRDGHAAVTVAIGSTVGAGRGVELLEDGKEISQELLAG